MAERTRKILVADPSASIVELVKRALQDTDCMVYSAANGQECIDKIAQIEPDLIIVELTLSLVYGIEILRRLRQNPATSSTGVVISTWRAVQQDYQMAMENGASYYLLKPFSENTIQRIVTRFYEGTLKPAPFPLAGIRPLPEADYYNPTVGAPERYIRFWGTRGSIPVAGQEYLIYGGNTACLEVCDGEHLVIIDAGSGIRSLGQQVLKSTYREIHLIIGHTHWDHILGFPFFSPVYSARYDVHIYAAKGFDKNVSELFKGMLDRDYFPVKLEEMQARFIFHDLVDNEPVTIGKIEIAYAYASHPGATLCFKIKVADKTIGYATDNEVLTGYHGDPNLIDFYHPLLFSTRNLIEFFQGCDILIHEAQYFPLEYRYKVGWGHSSVSNATVFVKHTKAKEWIVTHHDPEHTDQVLREKLLLHKKVLEECHCDCTVDIAYDGQIIPL